MPAGWWYPHQWDNPCREAPIYSSLSPLPRATPMHCLPTFLGLERTVSTPKMSKANAKVILLPPPPPSPPPARPPANSTTNDNLDGFFAAHVRLLYRTFHRIGHHHHVTSPRDRPRHQRCHCHPLIVDITVPSCSWGCVWPLLLGCRAWCHRSWWSVTAAGSTRLPGSCLSRPR